MIGDDLQDKPLLLDAVVFVDQDDTSLPAPRDHS